MIESIGSAISNSSAARNIAVEATSSNAAASNFELGDPIAQAPKAPFVSPYYAVDTDFDTAVLQIRDSSTGDVIKQFPSEATLEQRARQEAIQAAASNESSPANVEPPRASESSAFQASAIAQQGGQAGVSNSAGAAQAQAAIAAFSAGAQSGQASTASVNVTA